ncbi:MAG TPA: type II toxin-antitoxin system RelE/ParE family toxin [Candidatus Aquilonibacter sp.]
MKPVCWVGSSKKDLEDLPDTPRLGIRAAIFAAQSGSKVGYAKPMRGDLRDVIEVVAHDRGGTFRGMYYVGKELIYALHFFQKKSKHGIKTPKRELDLIRRRLTWARRR